MSIKDSFLREEEYRALSKYRLFGEVLDLGGDRRSGYDKIFDGNFRITYVNFDQRAEPDIFHDLEKALPVDSCRSASFEHVLIINVWEHIFNDDILLGGAKRVLKNGGSLIGAVPFIFPVHGSPHDFRRFTADAIKRSLLRVGFSKVEVHALGTGVFSAMFGMIERLLPDHARYVFVFCFRKIYILLDKVFIKIARRFGKKYHPSDYALGYVFKADL